MRHLFFLMLVLALTAPAAAQQPCRDAAPPTRPDNRFITNPDGTVRDLHTGLLWKQCVEGTSGVDCTIGEPQLFTWKKAVARGQTADFAGYTDWRLPDQTELSSLLQPRCYGVDLDAVTFPNTPPDRFWSTTPAPYYSDSVWTLHFGRGTLIFSGGSDRAYIRLVRDRAACSSGSPQFCVIH